MTAVSVSGLVKEASTTLMTRVTMAPAMQRWLVLLMVSLLAFAGCLGDDADDDGTDMDDGSDAGDQTRPPLPEPIEDSQMVAGGADPANFVTGEPCTNEMACTDYPFTAATDVRINAELTWTIEASDFDLYVYEGDEQVATSGQTPPGTSESISTTLSPGDYRVVVVAWGVAQDTYTLTATFEYA